MTTPHASSRRVAELDALRGLAAIGIVWMNVYVFALPAQSYYNPVVWGPGLGEGSSLDRLIWVVSFVFIEDKFRTLFAMLFGAGCLILLERGGERPWRAHFSRMAVLLVIGLAHAILLASNDILRAYAIAGCALPLLSALNARALFAICVGLVAVHVGGGIVALGSSVLDLYNGRTGSDAYLYADRTFGSNPAAVQYMIDQGREEFGTRIARGIESVSSQISYVGSTLPINLAAMALGMGLWKTRMLAGEWRVFLLQRCAAIAAIIAIPALFALAWWVSDNGFSGPIVGAAGFVLSAPFDTLLGLAYAAMAMAFFGQGGVVTERLAAVGRLALTNYLLTSVILTAIFAPWGLALFGEVSRSEALLLSFAPVTAMLLWSPVWLRWLGMGPFERLWRGAARLLS
ncbi:DUF418 domain-containing protein [uncultured Erythrobacter sp.]|uniref:DUF418 domain-containing protein n=1 Tax=uncultured Erythrobacter sp. TaxID=263913 RepID=UPI0026230DFA|nr:DUF418 domain-containing protein [uncultured Erythrobacter sp.]